MLYTEGQGQNPNTWNVDYNERTGGFLVVKGSSLEKFFEKISLEEVIEEINKTESATERPTILLLQTKSDTVVIEVLQSDILTQRMGGSGATGFIATTTFTLTQLSQWKFVEFVFEAGDHANPGTYSREDFKNGFY